MEIVTRDVQIVKWFAEIGIEDVPLVGGKNASLGEMYLGVGLPRDQGAERLRHSLHLGPIYVAIVCSIWISE